MSIEVTLSAARELREPERLAVALSYAFLLLSVLSPILAWRLGVFRRDGIAGPDRWGSDDSGLKFLLLIGGAVLTNILFTVVVFQLLPQFRIEQLTQEACAAARRVALLFLALPVTAKDMASPAIQQRQLAAGMLATGLVFVAVALGCALFRRDGLRRLGLTGDGILPGIVSGILGLIIILPWLFWLMLLLDYLRRSFYPTAPVQHEIFQLWQQRGTGRGFEFLAVFSAVVLAPLAEEALFRGLLQSALAYLFRGGQKRLAPPPQSLSQPLTWPLVLSYATPPPRARDPETVPRWAAIIVASLLFALMHRPWLITPPIFCLSLGLGYVYERTGNLWSSIFMHVFFNAFQFGLFLVMLGGSV